MSGVQKWEEVAFQPVLGLGLRLTLAPAAFGFGNSGMGGDWDWDVDRGMEGVGMRNLSSWKK